MNTAEFLEQAQQSGRIITLEAHVGDECIGRARGLVVAPRLAVMLEDCGDSTARAGWLAHFIERPGIGPVILEARDLHHGRLAQETPTPEEQAQLLDEMALATGDRERAANIEDARAKGYQLEPGVGYLRHDGQLMYDEDGCVI